MIMMKYINILIIILLAVPAYAKENATQFTRDDQSGSIVSIDWAHHETHDGDRYYAGYSDTLADTATITISFRTSSSDYPHMIFDVNCSGEAYITGYENPTVTVSTGSQLSAFNKNRLSSNTTSLLEATTGSYVAGNLALNATVAGGTAIFPEFHFGAGKKVGGSGSFSSEYILKGNEDYALVLTSEANSNHCSVSVEWYEN